MLQADRPSSRSSDDIFPISARKGSGVDALVEHLCGAAARGRVHVRRRRRLRSARVGDARRAHPRADPAADVPGGAARRRGRRRGHRREPRGPHPRHGARLGRDESQKGILIGAQRQDDQGDRHRRAARARAPSRLEGPSRPVGPRAPPLARRRRACSTASASSSASAIAVVRRLSAPDRPSPAMVVACVALMVDARRHRLRGDHAAAQQRRLRASSSANAVHDGAKRARTGSLQARRLRRHGLVARCRTRGRRANRAECRRVCACLVAAGLTVDSAFDRAASGTSIPRAGQHRDASTSLDLAGPTAIEAAYGRPAGTWSSTHLARG